MINILLIYHPLPQTAYNFGSHPMLLSLNHGLPGMYANLREEPLSQMALCFVYLVLLYKRKRQTWKGHSHPPPMLNGLHTVATQSDTRKLSV